MLDGFVTLPGILSSVKIRSHILVFALFIPAFGYISVNSLSSRHIQLAMNLFLLTAYMSEPKIPSSPHLSASFGQHFKSRNLQGVSDYKQK